MTEVEKLAEHYDQADTSEQIREATWVPGELQMLEPPLMEYAETRSMEAVNKLAAEGWRVHTAFLVPGSAAKLYLMERERP